MPSTATEYESERDEQASPSVTAQAPRSEAEWETDDYAQPLFRAPAFCPKTDEEEIDTGSDNDEAPADSRSSPVASLKTFQLAYKQLRAQKQAEGDLSELDDDSDFPAKISNLPSTRMPVTSKAAPSSCMTSASKEALSSRPASVSKAALLAQMVPTPKSLLCTLLTSMVMHHLLLFIVLHPLLRQRQFALALALASPTTSFLLIQMSFIIEGLVPHMQGLWDACYPLVSHEISAKNDVVFGVSRAIAEPDETDADLKHTWLCFQLGQFIDVADPTDPGVVPFIFEEAVHDDDLLTISGIFRGEMVAKTLGQAHLSIVGLLSVESRQDEWLKSALCLALVADPAYLQDPAHLQDSDDPNFSATNWGAASVHYMKAITTLTDKKWKLIMEAAQEHANIRLNHNCSSANSKPLDATDSRRLNLINWISDDE
ncbi:hypothetical protein EWM64_g9844 [Hericium alpestre]|uniref:Uncharacterized protein n=1 Tax=Hericium alpestre TaxID=135208 RepID=A0A4Y9ZKL3_9AGAM|nr:hypothetical protein EWM64_g9844 [Hericium alpestre]